MIDANTHALNKYLAKQQSGEEQLEEAQALIENRLADIIEDELLPLLREVDGLDYELEAKELIIEHLEASL